MARILEDINKFAWGAPAIVAILGVGIYLSVSTGFVQLRFFPKSLQVLWRRVTNRQAQEGKNVTPYQAFCTALGATVGTGNIAGVAGAIALGGPGSIFWMWISAFLGMATKCAEATISVHFQERRDSGEILAGPMQIIRQAMSKKWQFLAFIYCFFGVVAAFGVGNTVQINAVIGGLESVAQGLGLVWNQWHRIGSGIALAILIGIVLRGGAKGIGRFMEQMVPFAALFYILLCLGVLVSRWEKIDDAFCMIITGAFNPRAATGGVIGSFVRVIRVGTSRGVFTNEAGLGTAGIAHGSACVTQPAEQGMMGIMEVFLDTIVICTLTGMAILCSGISVPYGIDPGVVLTSNSFASVYGDWVTVPITISLILFAVATIMGWGLYGARCAQFIFGDKVWRSYTWLQSATALMGSVVNTGTLWLLTETVNGFMMIPNLIALVVTCPVLTTIIRDYRNLEKTNRLDYQTE